MAHYPADTFQEATEIAIEASNQLHGVINGDANAEVTVEDGSKIPSVRKAYSDSLFFLPPKAWVVGDYETAHNQLRAFTETNGVVTWWFPKTATVSTPTLMSITPHDDLNWTLWNAINNSVYETQKRLAAEAGLNMVGSFLLGATVTTTDDIVFYETDGKYYGWSGAFPKVVTAGATPATTGGIGAGAWVDRTDVTLRSELISADGVKMVGACPSISSLRSIEPETDKQQILVSGYYTKNDGAGGVFWHDAADLTSVDDGGAVIVTTGGKRWKRLLTNFEVTSKQFGCKADDSTDDSNTLQKFFDFVGTAGATGIISSGVHKITTALTLTSTKTLNIKSEPGSGIWVYAAIQAITISTTRPCNVYGLSVNPRVNGASGIRFNGVGVLVTRGIDVSSPNTTDASGFVTGLHYHNCAYTKTYDFWDMATSGDAFKISSNGKSSVSHDIFAPNIFGADTGLLVDIAGSVGAGVEGVRVFGGEMVTNAYGVYITNTTPYVPPLFKFSGCHINSDFCIQAYRVTHIVLSAVNLYCKRRWLHLANCGENSVIGGEFVCVGTGGTNPISLDSTSSIDITGLYSSYPTSHHMMALYNTPTEVRLRSSTYNVNNWSKNVGNGDVFVAGVAPAANSLFRDNFPQCPRDSTYDYGISANVVVLTDRGDVYRIIHTGTINNFTGNRNRAVTLALLPGVTLTHGSGLSIIGYANYTTTTTTYSTFIPDQAGTGWTEISRRA